MIDVIRQFGRFFEHDHWANRAALESFSTVPVLPAKTLKLMAHILAAQDLWLARLKGEDTILIEVWPEWTVEECEARLLPLERQWKELLALQTPELLKERVAYKNTKGERWENAVGDILMHVIFHGQYHRGQIAQDVRAAAGHPAYTDFIEAVRRGYVK